MFCLTALIAVLNGAVCQAPDAPVLEPTVVTEMALQAGWEEEQLEQLHCLIDHESSYRPGVASWNGWSWGSSVGLMQINHMWSNGFVLPDGTHNEPVLNISPYELLDPYQNLVAAKEIHGRIGWHGWDGYVAHCTHLDLERGIDEH